MSDKFLPIKFNDVYKNWAEINVFGTNELI